MHAVSDSTGERSGGVATPAAFGTIVLSTGLGVGPTALAAFDAALLDAGVANYNLICLSSVIPPGRRCAIDCAIDVRGVSRTPLTVAPAATVGRTAVITSPAAIGIIVPVASSV